MAINLKHTDFNLNSDCDWDIENIGTKNNFYGRNH